MRLLYLLRRVSPATFPFMSSNIDNPKPTQLRDDLSLLTADTSKPTGWEGVKWMFQENEWGEISPELANTLHTSLGALFLGAIYGGFTRSKSVFEEFIRNNHATAFQSHLEAKRALQSKISLSYGRGAYAFGWRAGLFTGLYSGLIHATALYRGKTGIIEYSSSGAIVGSLFRIHLGVRGVIVGGALGAFLGFLGGIVCNTLLWVSGITMDDILRLDHEWREKRKLAEQDLVAQGQDEGLNPIVTQILNRDEVKKTLLDTLQEIEKNVQKDQSNTVSPSEE